MPLLLVLVLVLVLLMVWWWCSVGDLHINLIVLQGRMGECMVSIQLMVCNLTTYMLV
jgi:hypothetical protein